MALAGALCVALNSVVRFTIKEPLCLGVPALRRYLQRFTGSFGLILLLAEEILKAWNRHRGAVGT